MTDSRLLVAYGAGGATTASPHPLPSPLDELLAAEIEWTALEDGLLERGGIEALALWHALRPQLERGAHVRYRVARAGRVVLAFTPAAPLQAPIDRPPSCAVRLSRFAHLRRDGDVLVLDSPRAAGRVEMLDPTCAALLACLASAHTAAQVAERLADDGGWVEGALALLAAAGLVLPADAAGLTAEDRSAHAAGWEFHDLVLHGRSRTGRADLLVGRTDRFGPPAGRVVPPSARDATREDPAIPLARADVAALARDDVPFTRVLEERRSCRQHAPVPMDVGQLGEFLFRTARVVPRVVVPGGAPDRRFRLYPGGGACYPLEVYVVVAHCAGLAPGLYHYDADAHALAPIAADDDAVQSLVRRSAVPMAAGSVQQVQLVLTARFARINRRYEGNAYALVLQEVGALYQTMYLVATAMGLAPCAVGGGNADAFARLIGTHPLEEASVGAFVIGSR